MKNPASLVTVVGKLILEFQTILDCLRGALDAVTPTQHNTIHMEILQSLVAALGEFIKTLREHFDQLRGARDRTPIQYESRLDNLESLLVARGEFLGKLLENSADRLRDARDRGHTQYSLDMDSSVDIDLTGQIFEDSFTKMLDEVSAQGDLDFSAVLEALRKKTFKATRSWHPIQQELKPKKKEIVRWMLSSRNVHKFSSDQVILTGRNCSPWVNLVEEVFADERNRKKKVALVNYFRAAARSTSFFGGFAKMVVRVHRERCESCGSP